MAGHQEDRERLTSRLWAWLATIAVAALLFSLSPSTMNFLAARVDFGPVRSRY